MTRTEKAERAERKARPQRGLVIWGILAAVLAVGAALRLADLSADPPLGLTWSHAPYTDGARIVEGARTRVLWGAWHLDPLHPITLYYPLSSVLAYVLFRLFGVGLWQANLTGVLPGLASLVLLFAAGRRRDVWTGVGASFLAAVSFLLVTYDRLPMCEPLMIAVMLGAPVLLFRERLGPGGALAAGVLVGAAGFLVKFHGLVLLPVSVLWLVLFREPRGVPRRTVGFFLAGVGAVAVAWFLLVLVFGWGALGDFLEHNLVSQYGQGGGKGLLGFLGRRISGLFGFGTNVSLFGRMPVVGFLAVLAALDFTRRWRDRRGRAFWVESFFALWFLGAVAALSLLDYRPLRYHLQVIPPMVMLATLSLARWVEGSSEGRGRGGRWQMALVLMFSTFIWFHLLVEVPVYMSHHPAGARAFLSTLGLDPGAAFTAMAAFVASTGRVFFASLFLSALVVAAFVGLRRRPLALSLSREARAVLAVLVVALSVLVDASLHRDARADPQHTLRDTSRDLGEILGPEAFLVGTTSTTLTLENRLRSLPAYGVVAKQGDNERFRSYPITHFLLREGTFEDYLQREFRDTLDSLVYLRRYVIGPAESGLYRVRTWPGTGAYEPTGYERGMECLAAGRLDEAEAELKGFQAAHPGEASAAFALGLCMEKQGRSAEAIRTMEGALSLAPEDVALWTDLAAAHARAGNASAAIEALRRALALQPRDARALSYLDALRRNLRGGARPSTGGGS